MEVKISREEMEAKRFYAFELSMKLAMDKMKKANEMPVELKSHWTDTYFVINIITDKEV